MNGGRCNNIKDKLGSLDTLSAGIVFGKEEAWDKLQARMDAKPKRIPMAYWMAAAAMLLLFVSIMVIYTSPDKQVVTSSNNNNEPIKQNKTVAQPAFTATQQQPTTSEEPTTTIVHNAAKSLTNTTTNVAPAPQQETTREPLTESLIVVVKHVDEEPLVYSNPAPAPAKKQYSIVHVNDIDNSAPQPAAVAANTTPTPFVKKQTVVHLNDITAQQQTMDNYLNRRRDNYAVSIPLLNSGNTQTTSSRSENENYTPHSSLKFKIN